MLAMKSDDGTGLQLQAILMAQEFGYEFESAQVNDAGEDGDLHGAFDWRAPRRLHCWSEELRSLSQWTTAIWPQIERDASTATAERTSQKQGFRENAVLEEQFTLIDLRGGAYGS